MWNLFVVIGDDRSYSFMIIGWERKLGNKKVKILCFIDIWKVCLWKIDDLLVVGNMIGLCVCVCV